jgi:hypothetical protein
MINIFVAILVIQSLFSLAFERYLFIPFLGLDIIYSLGFNIVFTALTAVILIAYIIAIKKHGKKMDAIYSAILKQVKYVIILNFMALLLSQICLLRSNRIYFYFFEKPTTEQGPNKRITETNFVQGVEKMFSPRQKEEEAKKSKRKRN